jgi:lipopolysaccharide export system permease protein
VFAVVGYGLTLFMNIYAMPWGFQSTYDLLYQVATRNIDIGLKERTFNDQFEDVVLYVNKVDVKDRRLIDVFIEDKRAGNAVSTILAPEGRLFSEPEKLVYHLRLYNGNISTVSLKDKSAHSIRFDTYDIRLDLKRLAGNIRRKSKDVSALNFDTIRNHLGESSEKDTFYYKVLIEYHKKFSIPFSCIALALLAVPLGVQSKTAKKSFGIILGLFFFLLYYMMITAGVILGETGALHPLIGMWVPNIVIAIVGLFLLIRTANERTVGLDLPLDLWRNITARFRAPKDQSDNQEESKI